MSEPPREHDVAVASTTVHVREWGPIDGPPLLFWHGLGSYTGLYVAEVAEALGRDHGLRVIAIDPPGVGRSPALPAEAYRPPELARLAAGLLEAMAIERCVFMGHSWGGLVGCHLAAEQPALVAALVLLDGGYEDSDVTGPGSGRALDDEVAAARGQQRSFDSWDALGEFLREHFPDLTPTAEAAWRAGHVERDGRVVDTMSPETVGAAAHGVRHAPAAATHAAIAASGLRVLLLVGGRGLDDVRRAALRRFSASLPAADVRVLADSSGDLVADLGPRLARLVGDWLSGGWYDRISAEGMLDVLAPYQPVVVGAHPLGLAAADTPVEVVCRATDLPAFARTVERAFGRRHGFALHGGSLDGEEAVFAEFDVSGLPVQLSAQAEHVHRRLGAATLGL
ncbi:MAG TPA: alpha/beta hydrolase, partial [Gaiellales bacterium]|nr:alpha/beta hydrolase [Gaiellales bacterium]